MKDFQDFVGKLQKRGSNRHKIGHCLGTRDAWKWVRKNKWKAVGGEACDAGLYSKIINEVNKNIVESILEGHIIFLPHYMGSIMLASLPTRVFMKDGEIQTTYRTDWKKTLDLWYKDEEARNSHKPIKRITKEIFFIRYQKGEANYHNKKFYNYRVNRSLVEKLGEALERGKINAARINLEDWNK